MSLQLRASPDGIILTQKEALLLTIIVRPPFHLDV